MSQWATIEPDGAATPTPGRSVPAPATSPVVSTPRLRRTERLVVGSIDGAAHVLQRRAREVLLGSALFLLPLVALTVLLTVLAFDNFDAIDGTLGERGYVGIESGFTLLAVVVQSFSAHLVGAYAAAYLVRYQMGGSPGIGTCAAAVIRRLPLLFATWVLTHWWAPLFGWWVITSDRSSVGGLLVMLSLLSSLITAAVLLVSPVIMGEQLGVRSIRRAWRLARTRFSAAFGFVWACGVLSVLLFSFIAFLPSLAEATGLITFGSYAWLAQGIAAQLALLIVVPFTALATAQLYLQLRVHAEGLDIVLAADRAFGSAT